MKYSKEELEIVVKNSNTLNEVLTFFKMNKGGGNYKNIRKNLILFDIDISHFLTRKETIKKANKIRTKILADILVKNSNYSGNNLKERLYKEGLKKRECEKCGQGEIWLNQKISLILDHIDGDHYNNEINNLRILCPNCNAATDTFCRGKKIYKLKEKSSKEKRKELKQNKYDKIRNIILDSKIDFSKKGWGVKLGKELNIVACYAIERVKKLLPEFYKEKCFKNKIPS